MNVGLFRFRAVYEERKVYVGNWNSLLESGFSICLERLFWFEFLDISNSQQLSSHKMLASMVKEHQAKQVVHREEQGIIF